MQGDIGCNRFNCKHINKYIKFEIHSHYLSLITLCNYSLFSLPIYEGNSELRRINCKLKLGEIEGSFYRSLS